MKAWLSMVRGPQSLALALLAWLAGPMMVAAADDESPVVKAGTMLAEYRVNELAANEKYKNRKIILRGVIKRVASTADPRDEDADDDGSFMICVGAVPPEAKEGEPPPPASDEVVVCYFTRGKKSVLVRLRAGRMVTIRGRCSGRGPSLENCTLL